MVKIELPERTVRDYVLVSASESTALDAIRNEQIIELYQQHGAILFRGFDLSVDELNNICNRFCTHSTLNNSANRVTIDRDRGIQYVDPGVNPFPLHPELSRSPWKPDICWFGCLTPPTRGGQTTICDGVEIVKQLPPAVRDAFAGRRLLYIQAGQTDLAKWLGTDQPDDNLLRDPPSDCPFKFFRKDATIFSVYSAPALHTPMFCDELAWGNFLFFARYQQKQQWFPLFDDGSVVPDQLVAAVKAVADELEKPIDWQTNDLLMLDNTRFMHGRRAIVDIDERVIITSFGYLNFARPSAEEPPHAKWRDPATWSARA